jgi:hypothetical protein
VKNAAKKKAVSSSPKSGGHHVANQKVTATKHKPTSIGSTNAATTTIHLKKCKATIFIKRPYRRLKKLSMKHDPKLHKAIGDHTK